MTHQPTQLLSRVWSGPVGICVIGLQLDFFLHSSLFPDCLVGSGPTYDSTVELGWVMCHGLNMNNIVSRHSLCSFYSPTCTITICPPYTHSQLSSLGNIQRVGLYNITQVQISLAVHFTVNCNVSLDVLLTSSLKMTGFISGNFPFLTLHIKPGLTFRLVT